MQTFTRATLVKGRPTTLKCVEIEGQTYSISGGAVRVLRLEEEWYEDVRDPGAVLEAVGRDRIDVDLFTFWQRPPHNEPQFRFHTEWEELAVLPVLSYDDWWNNRIQSRTRSLIRKSAKLGVEVRLTEWTDAFVRGMTDIFNETPVRQGRPFWHYGKNFETVKSQFSRYLFREHLIGAYFEGELIGFMMIADAGQYALVGQILSKVAHREKATNNALIARAVELCAEKGWSHFVYLQWGTGSFAEFKRRCGFDKMIVPRYYVPISLRGKAALRLGLHRGFREAIPPAIKERLKDIRSRWYSADE